MLKLLFYHLFSCLHTNVVQEWQFDNYNLESVQQHVSYEFI